MKTNLATSALTPEVWNQLVLSFPQPHLLQSWQWAEIKTHSGWLPHWRGWKLDSGVVRSYDLARGIRSGEDYFDALSLILQREVKFAGLPFRLRILYAPKGPLLRDPIDPGLRSSVLTELQQLASQQGAIYIKIDPDVILGTGIPGTPEAVELTEGQEFVKFLERQGWRFSSDQIQFRNTVIIDLTPSEEQLLANMKQKTRYNIRLATRQGVTVRQCISEDYAILYRLYAETATRDGFILREETYYHQVWETFLGNGRGAGLIAEVNNEPVAALSLFRFGPEAYFFYGMSSQAHREKMPNYLLQWEAIKLAKNWGCRQYDLWGAPDEFGSDDPMWGVYRFKAGLGGQVVRHLGAYDFPARPLLYWLYNRVMPGILKIMRSQNRQRLHREIV